MSLKRAAFRVYDDRIMDKFKTNVVGRFVDLSRQASICLRDKALAIKAKGELLEALKHSEPAARMEAVTTLSLIERYNFAKSQH